MHSSPWIQHANRSQDEYSEGEFLAYRVWTNRFAQYCQIALQTVGPVHAPNVSMWKFPLLHVLANFNIFANLVGVKRGWMASLYLHFITNWAENLFHGHIGLFCSYLFPVFLLIWGILWIFLDNNYLLFIWAANICSKPVTFNFDYALFLRKGFKF